MKLDFISTNEAPAAVGPYSQGIKAANLIFTSGQLPMDPKRGQIIDGDIKEMTTLCLNNVKAILKEAGAEVKDIIKVNIYVTNIEDFSNINEAYAEFFGEHKPARSLVEVAKLPKGGEIEIEAIAAV